MINELKDKIKKANESYRVGNSIISDSEYDKLVEELSLLSPDDELLTKVGHVVVDETRKSRLPIEMASMNKIKSMDDINDWCRLKGISKNEEVIITPKFDGLSLCVDEKTNEAWTRGDGEFGQRSDEHYKLIQNHLNIDEYSFIYTYGEVMIPKKVFIVPYRNRPQQKFFFSKYMTFLLEDLHEYDVYFSHQSDARHFNRGATKNIGFMAMKQKYPNHYPAQCK